MVDFGVTQDGFTIKGLDSILGESLARARQIFGSDIDLTPTSPLRKIIEVTAEQDAELWKRMEDLYYSNFVSTAVGNTLDALGEDLGVTRQELCAQGEVTFTISNPLPGRQYILAEGTILITKPPTITFYTLATVTLSDSATTATVQAQAFERGSTGNISAGQIVDIDPAYKQIYVNLSGSTTITVTNNQPFGVAPFSNGTDVESDEDYRARLLGLPRNIWTLESVKQAVLEVKGVTDVATFDPLGGVDVSQGYFNLFRFNERRFSGERHIGEPYFFDVVVAHEVAWPWHPLGNIPGIYERVQAAIDLKRPVGIHANIVQADHIQIGVRATVVIEAGQDAQSLLASIKQQLARDIGTLKLGKDVLFSQVMRAFVEQPGVADVQNMHLRRYPAAFGRITFGAVPFQATAIELPVGENVQMGPTEIAIFRLDSTLIDIQVVSQ